MKLRPADIEPTPAFAVWLIVAVAGLLRVRHALVVRRG
jgi:hypothetical protein